MNTLDEITLIVVKAVFFFSLGFFAGYGFLSVMRDLVF